jgi:hypothetical protein
VDLVTAFQKYARSENGQLILKYPGTEHLCKISIENGEAVYIKLGNLEVEEIFEFISGYDPLEVSFIKGFVPKRKLPVPVTEQILGSRRGLNGADNIEPGIQREYSSNEMISVSRVNRAINKYVDIVGPLGAVMLENILKKLNYTKNTPMPADDFAYLINQLENDVPQPLRVEFKEAIK